MFWWRMSWIRENEQYNNVFEPFRSNKIENIYDCIKTRTFLLFFYDSNALSISNIFIKCYNRILCFCLCNFYPSCFSYLAMAAYSYKIIIDMHSFYFDNCYTHYIWNPDLFDVSVLFQWWFFVQYYIFSLHLSTVIKKNSFILALLATNIYCIQIENLNLFS